MQANDESDPRAVGSSAGLGLKLRTAREAQDLSLEAVSAELRIGVHLLSALEQERFDELDAPVFAKGYLKQYGARLGLDVGSLVADYENAVGGSQVEIAPTRTISVGNARSGTILILSAIALLAVAVVLGIWWWLGSDVADVLISDLESGSDDQAVVAEPVTARTEAVEAAPVTEQTLVSASDEAPQAEVAAEEPAPPEPARINADRVLEIRFVEDSWTEVSDSSGNNLFYDLGLAGSVATLPADVDLNLFFGNAAGVELSIDGEPFEIPASARRGELAQFDLEAPRQQ